MKDRSRPLSLGAFELFVVVLAVWATAAFTAKAQAATPDAAARCTALAGKSIANGAAHVDDAAVVAASGRLVEACVVHATLADSTLRFELRLPLAGWNGKLAMLGGGGFDGKVLTAAEPWFSASLADGGYATIATNGGYDFSGLPPLYFAAGFAQDARKLADFTFESEHRALPIGKGLVAEYYGKAPAKSYFEGCSMGGHDALVEAQRYPNDFDGIVARAPAGNIMGLFLQFNRIAKLAAKPESALDAPRQKALAAAVLARCDALDGAGDGIVARPLDCRFEAKTLACGAPGADAATCLSAAQLAFVQAITSPVATKDGKWSHPGYPFGGEDSVKGWGEYVYASPMLGGQSLQGLFSTGFVRAFVTRDAAFDAMQWNADDWRASLDLIGSMFDASNADVTAFAARGGKLLMWNGTTDTSVSVRDTVAWYDRATRALGPEKSKSLELFLAPGVGHCFGGAGPDQVDLIAALDRWVEAGTPPSQQALAHRKLDAAGKAVASRPLCAYPAYAKHDGKGPANDAKSYACSMP